MPRTFDGPSDGRAETIMVLELEEKLAQRDADWQDQRHAQLQERRLSGSGIRRRHWLELRALTFLLRRRELARRAARHG